MNPTIFKKHILTPSETEGHGNAEQPAHAIVFS